MRLLGVAGAMSESNSHPADIDGTPKLVGERVFGADGEPLGVVRSLTQHGFDVSTDPEATGGPQSTSGEFGEAYLMWRCLECGEMGEIDGMPDRCPNCEAEKESLYYRTED